MKYLKLGQSVKLNDTTPKLFVAKAELVVNHDKNLGEGHFYAKYLLVPEEGLQQNRRYNQRIVGTSLPGKVIKVKQDRVKVHLDIDKDRKQEAAKSCLFPYMTPYTAENHTGWYCMPENGDTVNLYFPTNKEEESVVIHSYRKEAKENDKIDSPEVKYFRTKFGKELKFTDKEILITGKDNEILIRLNEDDGIEIQSAKKVMISSAGELTIHSDSKVNLQAGTGLELVCNGSSITMDGVTHIKGKQIKTN